MATATTPTRRAASRSAAPSSSRSSRSHHKAMSRGGIPSSPLARIIDEDIPIDPALLDDGPSALQDDLDAEGEVDDGVGYYVPVEEYYYPPDISHAPSPFDNTPLPDIPASSSVDVPPPNGFDYGALTSHTIVNGVVKKKRGRPFKNAETAAAHAAKMAKLAANGNLAVMRTPRQNAKPTLNTPRPTNGTGVNPITPETVCSLCGGTHITNRDGNREKMVSCVRCGRSGHPSCLGITSPAVVKKMRSYDWCCIECKPCEVCLEKGEDHKLLFCDGCDRGWHSYCLNPPLSAPPKGMWYCPMCTGAHKPTTKASSSKAVLGSPIVSRKGKGRAIEGSDTPKSGLDRKRAAISLEESLFPEITPKIKLKTNGVKEVKRRKRTSTSQDPSAPTGIVVRLRVPNANRKEKEEEVEEVPYGGILEPEDADTSHTTILQSDQDLFNKALKAAEARLGGPPPPLWDPMAMIASPGPMSRPTTPGPSKGLPSKDPRSFDTPPILSKATPGNVTPISASMARSLRDRVLLQQSTSLSGIPGTPVTPSVEPTPTGRPEKINKIRFGTFDIDTWYTAPYPEEYAQVPDGRLWLCEFCLKYMKSGFVAGRHRMKCKARHPPGDEIYRDGAISVFEVDGRKNKIYCQNLCLLAKMFLDHKTLYYDVEPFLFYVMTEVDEMGARFVGYFSKEKRTPQNNVSCIMTLPVRQRKGWGQLLIDFSYLLSKKEGRVGSPERPLSGLGALSYKSYWRLTVYKYLATAEGPVTLQDISAATSMTLEDIFVTLQEANMIRVLEVPPPPVLVARPKARRGRPPKTPRPVEYVIEEQPQENKEETKVKIPKQYEIVPDHEVVEAALSKHFAKGYLTLKPERLKYTPFLVAREAAQIIEIDDDASETPSSGNKEVIATPADTELTPIPDTSEKIAAGEDQATLQLVAALSASPVRNLRRRSSGVTSAEQPSKQLRSGSSPMRRRSTRTETPTRPSRRKSVQSLRKRIADPDEDWGDEDAEGEDDEEYEY